MKTSRLVCPVCKGTVVRTFEAQPKYILAKCAICEFVWDSAIKRELTRIYQKRYFANQDPKGGYANYFEGMQVNRQTFADRLKKIESKLGKRGKLLDVGCALGECLIEADRLGWKEIWGVELSDFACKFAKKRGLRVKKGTLENTFPPDSFDAVLYQDVIEHIPDPVRELKKAKRVLKKGGVVFLVTPDVGGLWAKVLGKYWYHYKPKEHLVYFSQKSITRALKEAGFSKIETQRTHHVLSVEYIINRLRYYFPNLMGWALSFVRKTPLRNIPVKSYTGELEAWGQKLYN